MKIPALFEGKLAQSDRIRGAVYTCIAEFEPWLTDSKLPFFPDYTDHGIHHLENVLATACALIATTASSSGEAASAESCFTASDAAILILATIFHDLALHLTEASFFQFLNEEAKPPVFEAFGDASWAITWEHFLFEAKKWDEPRQRAVLGVDEHGRIVATVRDPLPHWNNLLDSDRKLVGEFIRLHHGRIAQECAIYGIPGYSGLVAKLPAALTEDESKLIGLVARSHTLALRDCVDALGGHFGDRRVCNGVHAAYLMVLFVWPTIFRFTRARLKSSSAINGF